MPLGVTEKNIQKVFAEHLQPGENALVVTMCGARGTLGITDQNRVIQTNFPFFGKSIIKDEYYVSDIFSCECSQKGSYTMVLSIDAKGEKRVYKSTITPMVDSKALANKFAALVLEKNGNARPTYLDSDEDIIDHIATKKNNYKITSKNIIKFNKDNEIEAKVALSEYAMFDFYPGKMDSTYLYFETKAGDKQLLNIGTSSTTIMKFAGQDPEDLINKLYGLLGSDSYPAYLNGEALLTTLRAGTSLMGAVNPSHILKLTSNRLLDLKIDGEGGLAINKEIVLADIDSIKITRNRGQHSVSDIYEVKIIMKDKTKLKYAMGAQYIDGINLIREQIA